MNQRANTVAIVQARMGSSRLPGKVLLDLEGEPVLARVVQRLKRATSLTEVVVATSTDPRDIPIEQLCSERGWHCSRGSEEDVLDRFYQAAKSHSADVVVRISADSPLIDPTIVDEVVAEYMRFAGAVDHVSNVLPWNTFPVGLATEAFAFDLLGQLWRDEENLQWREHVTERVFQTPQRFRIRCIRNDVDYSHFRWTLDTPADMELIRRVFAHFQHDRFSWQEALELILKHPDWTDTNRHIQQKAVA